MANDKERDPQSQQTPGGQPAGQQGQQGAGEQGEKQNDQPVGGQQGGQGVQPAKSPEELGDKKDDTSGLKEEEDDKGTNS